jgi:nuclear GTP-binding protein
MAALLASARARAVEYEENPPSDDDEESTNGDISVPASTKPDASRKAFTNLFQSVLSSADIILYVLDARDPMSTRSRQTERQIATYSGGSKRLVLILNKIDLVPPKVLKAWLAHLRRSFPTLPLRASAPAANARTFDHKALTQKATTETLLRSLKSYASSQSLKRALTVAVVGFPNVGKSSVINALTSKLSRGNSSACPVGAEAGVTTALREVKLDNKLKLLDSPGIVFPSAADADSLSAAGSTKETPLEAQARLILLNALPPKQIVDPIPAITLLLKRLSASPTSFQAMLDVYGLPPLMTTGGDMTTDFLVQVARKRGRLGKGGVPNLTSAAMGVVSDWRDGRIQGWVDVPSGPEDDVADKDVKEIVKGWGEEFKIEGLWGSGADEVVEDEEVAMET